MLISKLLVSLLFVAFALNHINAGNDENGTYTNPEQYEIVDLKEKSEKPRNIILFIGDGVGVSQINAALTANGGKLNLNHMKHIGFSETQSADNYVTDSSAGGSAIATGQRIDNGAVAMDAEGNEIPTILQYSNENNKSTGIVVSCAITHATPASFYAHQPSRNNYEEIAEDLLSNDIDIFIGGGLEHFNQREDGRDLTVDLANKGYTIFSSLDDGIMDTQKPIAVFTHEGHPPRFNERGDLIPQATAKAIEVLNKNEEGFFLMVEGAQIDWGGHANSTSYIIGEMLDMDRAIGEALKFAAEDGETLVIVTSDHETGGMALHGGDAETGTVTAEYTTGGHTGVMVPTFAYGPGAELFMGIYHNTEIFFKMMNLFHFDY
ncbi:alkaline phosphatase [Marinilabiliaceae bacterium ANBcel2]|nr:alkaline phosphatase [Marinilabiliaceae bacterium ANBcel2]